MRILVIGGSGLVGTNVINRARQDGHDVYGTYHTNKSETGTLSLDKTDENAVIDIIEEYDPAVVVDTAAFDDVDACETERSAAMETNVCGTRHVACGSDRVGAHYVTFSTDYVFPGNREEAPYSEDDRIAPVNYYGRTRYAGEQAARIPVDWTVLRTSVIYGLESDNFATWAISELERENEIQIVDDQISTPTYAPDLGRAVLRIAKQGHTGLYHAAGPQSISRYEFTRLLAKVYGFDQNLITPISTPDLGQTAPRPEDTSLDSTKLIKEIDFEQTNPWTAFEAMVERGATRD